MEHELIQVNSGQPRTPHSRAPKRHGSQDGSPPRQHSNKPYRWIVPMIRGESTRYDKGTKRTGISTGQRDESRGRKRRYRDDEVGHGNEV